MSTDELLADIRQRPGLYIHQKCLRELDAYLRGWSQARQEMGIDDVFEGSRFSGYVNKLNDINTTAGWPMIIELFWGGFDNRAFEKFFELYEQFKTEDPDNDFLPPIS